MNNKIVQVQNVLHYRSAPNPLQLLLEEIMLICTLCGYYIITNQSVKSSVILTRIWWISSSPSLTGIINSSQGLQPLRQNNSISSEITFHCSLFLAPQKKMSGCGGNCNCGSDCKCDSSSKCGMFPDIENTTTTTIIAGVAPPVNMCSEGSEKSFGAEGGHGCKCGSNCKCDPCTC